MSEVMDFVAAVEGLDDALHAGDADSLWTATARMHYATLALAAAEPRFDERATLDATKSRLRLDAQRVNFMAQAARDRVDRLTPGTPYRPR